MKTTVNFHFMLSWILILPEILVKFLLHAPRRVKKDEGIFNPKVTFQLKFMHILKFLPAFIYLSIY